MLGRNLLRSGNAGVPNVSHYDLALALLPLPLLAGPLAGELSAVPVRNGVSADALVSALVLGYLLFGDPPTRRGPPGRGRIGDQHVGESSP
jgi:hypothetical protein